MMLKARFLVLGLLIYGATFAQEISHYNAGAYIYYQFIYFPRAYSDGQVFHNQTGYYLPPEALDTKLKRDLVYQYIHNGDNIKAAQDVFENEMHKTWFRALDVGEFANLTFELSPDRHSQLHSPFQWSGSIIFFKLFHRRPLGKIKRRLVKY